MHRRLAGRGGQGAGVDQRLECQSAGADPGIAWAVAASFVAAPLSIVVEAQLACGVAAVIGQMWPVFHRFDGGRANSTGWGVALAVDPIAFLIMMVPVLAAIGMRSAVRPRPTRVLPLAGLLSFAVFPAVIWEQDGLTPAVTVGVILFTLILVRRVTAGLGEDLATGAPAVRVVANRALVDRSELQQRGVTGI